MLLACAAPDALCAQAAPWILIDTHALSLSILSSHDRLIARFTNIAIGSEGAARVHYKGDETTPRGTYHVAWIDRHSRFGVFYGLDYPTPAVAARAYLGGRIGRASFRAIIEAFRLGRLPPQDTPLGGDLGIHGIGAGARWIQRSVNWTDGCVALGARQAQALARWVHLGTVVVIR